MYLCTMMIVTSIFENSDLNKIMYFSIILVDLILPSVAFHSVCVTLVLHAVDS